MKYLITVFMVCSFLLLILFFFKRSEIDIHKQHFAEFMECERLNNVRYFHLKICSKSKCEHQIRNELGKVLITHFEGGVLSQDIWKWEDLKNKFNCPPGKIRPILNSG